MKIVGCDLAAHFWSITNTRGAISRVLCEKWGLSAATDWALFITLLGVHRHRARNLSTPLRWWACRGI
jgi:hypothetical protein